MKASRHGSVAVLTAAVLAVGGCGGLFGSKDEAAPVYCPQAEVLEDGGTLTRFREGGGRDLTDVAFQARITGLSLTCRVAGERSLVDLRVGLEASRGPAAIEPTLPLTYFVAIADPGGAVLSREEFSVSFELPDRRSRAQLVEELVLTIPAVDAATLGRYRIYAALQLTPEELQYNRDAP